MIFIDCGEPDRARNHDVRLAARVANLLDTLAWREGFDLDLAGKDRTLFIIKQGEEGHLSQNGWVTGHGRLLSENE